MKIIIKKFVWSIFFVTWCLVSMLLLFFVAPLYYIFAKPIYRLIRGKTLMFDLVMIMVYPIYWLSKYLNLEE
jgi:hypothetical protein